LGSIETYDEQARAHEGSERQKANCEQTGPCASVNAACHDRKEKQQVGASNGHATASETRRHGNVGAECGTPESDPQATALSK
jgi:hypothetical protein